MTDIHGSGKCFRKFVNAAQFYKAKTLILGGDVTGKVLIPIVETEDGRYSLSLFGEKKKVGRETLHEYRRLLGDAGQYSFLTTDSALAELASDKERKDAIFKECMAASIKEWIALANSKLRGTGVVCYISPGNDDVFEIDEVLKDDGVVVNPEDKVVTLDGSHEMITLGCTNPTPWRSPREVSEEELEKMIARLAEELRSPAKSVFNLHVPPIGTEIDRAPAVDEEFRHVREGLATVKIVSAGSSAVRTSIERYQPLLGLHGHIHESRGFTRLGRTLCVNPGSEYSEGILRGALVTLDEDKIAEFLLTTG